MKYISTRGNAPILDFDDVVLTGLARDGGLYVPEYIPTLTPAQLDAMATQSYEDIAFTVMRPFIGGRLDDAALRALIAKTYGTFDHAAIAPLVQLDQHLWLLELFHGPTLAFKDYALQFLGHLFDAILAKRGQRICVVGATSGDTGSAALAACANKSAVDIVILHPHGRVSDVQRRQMTSIIAPNVHNIAIKGTFDDGQDIVKALFNDLPFRDRVGLAAINSINWARVLAQVVYYVVAAVRLGAPHRPVSFAVPTGNFGNVYAAYVARQMGVPMTTLAIGTNKNDILHRFFTTGTMKIDQVDPSLSPSMDIQVSSNVERYLFDLKRRDGKNVAATMAMFRQAGEFSLSADEHARAQATFTSARLDDESTLQVMRDTYARSGYTLDPHTAIGVGAAHDVQGTVIALACAHPAKFPDAVQKALGEFPAMPTRLKPVMEAEERYTVMENSVEAVKEYVLQKVSKG